MNKQISQLPVKLAKGETLVKKYKMYEAKKSFKKSRVFMFVTNKRIIICENKKTLSTRGTNFHEYDINKITDISTSLDDYKDFRIIIFSIILACFLLLFPFGLIIGLLLVITSIILAFVLKKSDGTVKLLTSDRKVLLAEVSTRRAKILSRYEQVKYKNVKRAKDFTLIQYELGAVIKDIQNESDIQEKEVKPEIKVDEIPNL